MTSPPNTMPEEDNPAPDWAVAPAIKPHAELRDQGKATLFTVVRSEGI